MPEFDATTEYRPIPFLPEEFYRVGNDGSVWSCQKPGGGAGRVGSWRRLKDLPTGKGYFSVHIGVSGKHQRCYIHRLVLEAFIGPCPEGMECCHEDGNRANNVLSNLRWGTLASNQADRITHGTDHRGEKHYRAKLTAEKVLEIRKLAAEGRKTKYLAEQFGVAAATISDIVARRTWPHVS